MLAAASASGDVSVAAGASAPCTTEKDNTRVREAYARGAHVFPQLGAGLRAQELVAPGSLRIAIVMPWVVEATPDATCRTYQTKPEMKAGARCEAFFSLPTSWPYWLASAGRNVAIADFLIFHEPGLSDESFRGPSGRLPLPSNVKLVEVANLTALYRLRVGAEHLRLNPDKIKDFKPVIGHVFEDYLKQYTHWAFGDVDVVYGDLRRFLSPPILSHSILTFRCDDLCASMTKTLFAGQLTIFANDAWARTLYRAAPTWQRVSASDKYMFFDERSYPAHALRAGAPRVAMLLAQLSDRLFTRNLDAPVRGLLSRSGLQAVRRHLVWRGLDGRLILVDSRPHRGGREGSGGGGQAGFGSEARWCVPSEAALVHLQQHKFKHYGRPLEYDAAGFVFDRDRGIRPASSLNASGDSHDAVLLQLLTRSLPETGGLGEGCSRWGSGSLVERSAVF
jgi:hypothetical protein